MMNKVLRALLVAAIASLSSVASAQIPGNAPAGTVFGNETAASRPGHFITGTAWFDRWCSSTASHILYRAAGNWVCGAMSGDATFGATGALTLGTVNSNVGTFGSASNCITLTTNAKGLITAISQTTCSGGAVSSFNARTGAVVPQADDYATTNGMVPPGNCTIAASVTSNNLTVALVNNAGATPSATTPCTVTFNNATLSFGSTVTRVVTAASSLVLNSGSTLGSSNATPFRVWVTLVDTGSTAVLGASVQSNANNIFPLDEGNVVTTLACNACATASTAGTIYTTAAQSAKPFRIAAYMEWASGLTTAGTWASGPTLVRNFGAGMRKPGDVVQATQSLNTVQTNNSTASYVDSLCTRTITPTSAANYVNFAWKSEIQITSGNEYATIAMRRGGTIVGLPLLFGGFATLAAILPVNGVFTDAPGSTGTLTYTLAFKQSSGSGGLILPHNAGGCVVQLQEIMG